MDLSINVVALTAIVCMKNVPESRAFKTTPNLKNLTMIFSMGEH